MPEPEKKASADWGVSRDPNSFGNGNGITSPVNFKAVSAVANGRWPEIHQRFGIPAEYLKKQHGPCPACGGTDRFRFDDKNGSGSYFCNQACGAGDGFQLLQAFNGWSAQEALHAVASFLGLSVHGVTPANKRPGAEAIKDSQKEQQVDEVNRKSNERIWSQSKPIAAGSIADTYLKNRCLNLLTIPAELREHSALTYKHGEEFLGKFPALVASVQNQAGDIIGLHRTFLTTDGNKADVPKVRKWTSPSKAGAYSGSAIQLGGVAPQLGISEGIETALACTLATGIPTWAAMSASLMEMFEPPDEVTELVIFADNDLHQAGQKAAQKLAARLAHRIQIKILVPPEAGQDWLDVYTASIIRSLS